MTSLQENTASGLAFRKLGHRVAGWEFDHRDARLGCDVQVGICESCCEIVAAGVVNSAVSVVGKVCGPVGPTYPQSLTDILSSVR